MQTYSSDSNRRAAGYKTMGLKPKFECFALLQEPEGIIVIIPGLPRVCCLVYAIIKTYYSILCITV